MSQSQISSSRNCRNCRFYSVAGCAINPDYFHAFKLIHQMMTPDPVLPFITDCPDQQTSEVKTLQLTLNEHEWRAAVEKKWLPERLRRQIAESIGIYAGDSKDIANDIPF
jgi:hypothetical protein